MFVPRLITVIVGIPVVLFVIYWGGIPYFLFVLSLTVLGLKEYFQFMHKKGAAANAVLGIVCGALLLLSMYLNRIALGSYAANQGTAIMLTGILALLFIPEFFRAETTHALSRIGVTLLGLLFVPWAFGHLLLIRDLRPFGAQYTLFLFLVIWVVDISAYMTGKFFGYHKLLPNVSPRKTFEGLAGALVCGGLFAMLCSVTFMRKQLGIVESLLLGFSIALIAQFSDLAESLIKRSVGVKDSSALLPGHGGILDRFDSFIFSAPFLYYYLSIFHK